MTGVSDATMKAVVMRAFGGPEVLRYEDFQRPRAAPGEVVVKVGAVSVNRTLDLVLRAGQYVKPVALPHILGVDPSGTVVETGEGVESPRIGDRVFVVPWRTKPNAPSIGVGVQQHGGYADYVSAPATATVPVPEGLDFAAATVAGRHLAAAITLCDAAEIKAGDWVLVMGAAGGLGSAGVQVARHRGAHVICAAGSDERVEAVKALGAEAGVNYRTTDLTAAVLELTGGKGVDAVLENVGDPDLFPKAFAAIGKFGRLVTSGAHAGGRASLDIEHLFRNQITMKGVLGSSREGIASALQLAGEMKFKPLIDRIMPLADAAEAHRLVEQRVVSGKIVLDPTLAT